MRQRSDAASAEPLCALIERCSELGYRQMVAVIGGSDQWPSIRLHGALGFTRTALLPAVGFKFGNWVEHPPDAACPRTRRNDPAGGVRFVK